MIKNVKQYFNQKPKQAYLMLIVILWSVYDITATSISSNSALTKEFMNSRYVMIWPMVDKKAKLYHYAEEWTNPVLEGLMHLDYANIQIIGYPGKIDGNISPSYIQSPNKENYEISFSLDDDISLANFSTASDTYYLNEKNASIVEEKTGKTVEQLRQEVKRSRDEFLSVLGKMKTLRLIYLLFRLTVLLIFIKLSGQRRKMKENEVIQNGSRM